MAEGKKGAVPAVAVIVGIIVLYELSHRPSFQAYRTVDVITLIACGMCFGVALMWLIQRLSRRTAV